MDENAFLIDLSESEYTDFGRVDYEQQPAEQQVFTAIWTLENCVHMGGFESWFAEDERAALEAAPEALRRIGAERVSAIASRALAAQDDASALAELEQQFFARPDDLTHLLFEFVRANSASFGPTPSD